MCWGRKGGGDWWLPAGGISASQGTFSSVDWSLGVESWTGVLEWICDV